MDITVVDQQSAECISHIISLSVPRDACKSSLVCHVFKSAADSDSVGEVSVVRLQRDRRSNGKINLANIAVVLQQSFAAEQSGKKCYVFLVYPRISLKTFRVESTLKKSMKGKGDGNEARLSQDRRDEWMKVEMGKYFDENGDDNILASILLNFERSSTKHGLIIQ
ncbi:hypothetical protein CUMW_125900 [Citrus unshiu]|nr:hypothetical protein CUMW_125900 [Citrus unshiu]